MKKFKNKKFIIFILILFISIGFAYLSATLNIAGLIGYKGNSWNIYFDNVQMIINDVEGEKPTINNSKDTISFNINFNEPSEDYKFSVDVVNDGTIDAMLGELIRTGIDSSNQDYIDYTVSYPNGDSVVVNDLLKHGTKVRIIVDVVYKNTTERVAPAGTGNYSLSLKYIQANDNANPVDNYFESGSNNTFVLNNAKANTLSNLKIYGNTSQTEYSGQNLYNVDDLCSGNSCITNGTTRDSDGWITMTYDNTSGTSNEYTNYFTNNLDLVVGDTYTIVLEVKSVSGTGSITYASRLEQNGVTNGQLGQHSVSFASLHAGDVVVTTQQALDGYQWGLRSYGYWAPGNGGSITFRLSVIKGTDITTDNFVYEPYVGGKASPSIDYPQDAHNVNNNVKIIIHGKNLFDGELEHGIIDATSGQNSSYNASRAVRSVNYIAVNPNTKYHISNDMNYTNLIYEYDENYNYISGSERGNKNFTFTTGNSTSYIRIRSRYANDENDLSVKFQIEEGDTATEWEPYSKKYLINLGSLELNKIRDYADYIYYQDGDWYVHKEIAKFKLRNTFAVYSVTNHYYSASLGDYALVDNAPFCTHFRGVPSGGDLSYFVPAYKNYGYDLIGFNKSHSYNRIYIKSQLSDTDLNSFISNNNIYLYYKLDNFSDTKITDTTLINQLNGLITNNLFDGTNYITVIGSDLAPTIEFDYVHE